MKKINVMPDKSETQRPSDVIASISDEIRHRKPFLAGQLSALFDGQIELFSHRGGGLAPDKEKQYRWAETFAQKFILVRGDRANDLNKPELTRARELAVNFIGQNNHHFVLDCMDGRNMPAVEMSHVPHVGGTARTPAGELMGIMPGINGNVRIQPDSYLVQSIETLLRAKKGGRIFYSEDSHKGCAARGLVSQAAGTVYDSGLKDDVARKIEISRGLRMIRDELARSEDVAEIYPQFYTYDPHDGSITMGLEMHVNQVGKKGFTQESLERLNAKGKIVTTWDFLNNPEIKSALSETVKEADFRSQYAETMLSNWQAITQLYDQGDGLVYQTIYQALEQAYKTSGWNVGEIEDIENQMISEIGLNNKAKLMLKNLVTRWSIAQDSHEWPFDEHPEQGVVFTEGGYGPFAEIDVFSLFSKQDNDLLMQDTLLALDLVRSFRKLGVETQGKKGIVDPLGLLKGDNFVEAPIMIMNKSILRNIPDAHWEQLQQIDLSNLLQAINWNDFSLRNWDKHTIEDLLKESNGNFGDLPVKIASSFVDGAYELFDRMRHMVLKDTRFSSMLVNGNIMLINLIVDTDRRARMLLPITV
jgi:hypothetical protein